MLEVGRGSTRSHSLRTRFGRGCGPVGETDYMIIIITAKNTAPVGKLYCILNSHDAATNAHT